MGLEFIYKLYTNIIINTSVMSGNKCICLWHTFNQAPENWTSGSLLGQWSGLPEVMNNSH
jgi:hypothetical protein